MDISFHNYNDKLDTVKRLIIGYKLFDEIGIFKKLSKLVVVK